MVDLFTGADLKGAAPKGQQIKFVGDMSVDPFPKLKGRCSTAKTSLTKQFWLWEGLPLGLEI